MSKVEDVESEDVEAEVHVPVEQHSQDDKADVRRSTRVQTFTEKGFAYLLQRKDTKRELAFKRAINKAKDIESMLIENVSRKGIEMMYSHWLTFQEIFMDARDEYADLLTEEEKQSDYHKWFLPKAEVIQQFRNKIEAWLRNVATSEQQPVHRPKSIRSDRTQSTTASSAKLREAQNIAELKRKAAALEKKTQLAQAKLALEANTERFAIEEGLAIADARSKAIDDFDEQAPGEQFVLPHYIQDDVFLPLPTRGVQDTRETHTPRMDPNAPDFIPHQYPWTHVSPPCKSESGDHNTEIIRAVVHQLKKPQVDMIKFGGDPLVYRKFIRQFNAHIVSHTEDDDERITYLEQLTTGEVNKLVLSYSHLDASIGYKALMKELEERYGDNERIASSYIQKALKWPPIKGNDAKSIDQYAIFLSECENAAKSINSVRVLEYPDNMRRIIGILPFHLHDRWRTQVQRAKDNFHPVDFHMLVEFVKMEARKLNHPIYGRDVIGIDRPDNTKKSSAQDKHTLKSKGSHTGVTKEAKESHQESKQPKSSDDSYASSVKQCLYCEDNSHSLDVCKKLPQKPFSDRIAFLKSKGLCFGCLKSAHCRANCRNKSTCAVCKYKHPTILHITRESTSSNSEHGKNMNTSVIPDLQSHVGQMSGDCTFAIVPVRVRMKDHAKEVETYAFLDPGSNVSFCSKHLMNQISSSVTKHQRMRITVDTMGTAQVMNVYSIKGMEVTDLDNQHIVTLPQVFTKDKIPASAQHIPREEDIAVWPHLEGICLPQLNASVDLLIGNNVPDAYSPLEVKTGPRGSPHACKTRLGWVVWNLMRMTDHQELQVNRADVKVLHQLEEDQQMDNFMQRYFNMDFPERRIDDRPEASIEDKKFMKKVESSLRLKNGHYEIGLPFREDLVQLPQNERQVLHRLSSLKKKLQRDDNLLTEYTSFMEDLLNQGYAETVPASELNRKDKRVWYIPHHCVFNPNKPGKLRVVFDCAASFCGVSLNQLLLQGPDLANSLLGVLLQFRVDPVAVMADIKSMFYQVRVNPEDVDCLRFYWWPKGNIEAEPVAYRMLVHIFGAVSSPTCANMALRKTAEDNQHLYNPDVAKAVRHFYVDDLLISLPNEEKAIMMSHDVADMCSRGGFHLTKWSSNSRSVLMNFPVEKQAKHLRNLDIEKTALPMEKAIGVHWCAELDYFTFNIADKKDQKATRRSILSVVSSIFDPLGLAAPFILKAKLLLQELCRQKISWDHPLEGNDLIKWLSWLTDLMKLNTFQLPRCIKPAGFGEVMSFQLHTFSDASDLGYGVTVYARLMDQHNQVNCTLLLSRARVNPLKKMTIPRLELTAATIAVKLHKKIIEYMDVCIHASYFWTDSMSVLRYIWSDSRRFHTFVSNRVSLIREATHVKQWRYVPSSTNPADDVSRGLDIDELLTSTRWQQGPEFLKLEPIDWPKSPVDRDIPADDPEVKRNANISIIPGDPLVMDRLLNCSSSWLRLKKIVAWILLAKRNLKYWSTHRKILLKDLEDAESEPSKRHATVDHQMMLLKKASMQESQTKLPNTVLTVNMLNEAEHEICRFEQQRYLSSELSMVESGCNSKVKRKNSTLHKLDPILHDRLMRVGGRLGKAPIQYESKHPIILPRDSPVSKLILMSIHQSIGHLGQNAIMADARQRFWIIGGINIIKKFIGKCVICRKYKARCQEQKMADLPVARTIAGEPPFSRTGIDYFGPIEVKRGRSTIKRYGVLFTCLSIRAVHLELAFSLDTDSCINCIRRFISRRGPVKAILSDNGTNLTSAEKELRQEILNLNQNQIHNQLLQKGIDWHFNPPTASHFGGVWERVIRSVRRVLYALMKQQCVRLDDDGLMTLFCEIEAILNGRPITKINSNSDDYEALTPNHLLLLQSGETSPCGQFSADDNYSKRRWRQVQHLANLFWNKWSKEYLTALQERQKSFYPKTNVSVGDVVLLSDTSLRNSWTLGRIKSVQADKHGLVRVVEVKTKTNTLLRPVHKLCVLLEADKME